MAPSEPGRRPHTLNIRESDIEKKLQSAAEVSGCLPSLDPIDIDVATQVGRDGRTLATEVVPGVLPAATMRCLEHAWLELQVGGRLPDAFTFPLRITVHARNEALARELELQGKASHRVRAAAHAGQQACGDAARADGWLGEGGLLVVQYRLDATGTGVAEATIRTDETGRPGLAECVRLAVMAVTNVGGPELAGAQGQSQWVLKGRTVGVRTKERQDRIADGRIAARECGRGKQAEVPVVVLLDIDEFGRPSALRVELDRPDSKLETCIRSAFADVGLFGADLPDHHRVTFVTYAAGSKDKLSLSGKRAEPKDSEEQRREREERRKREEQRRKNRTPQQRRDDETIPPPF